MSRRGQPDIRLVVVGYTNVIIRASRPGAVTPSVFSMQNPAVVSMQKAIIQVTNCGQAPVMIASLWQAYPAPQIPVELAGSYLQMPTTGLNPGKAESVVTFLPAKESGGWLMVAYQRLGWIERLADNARNSRHAIMRNLATKLIPTAKLHWAQSGCITNPPPPAGVRRYHISAPPPEIPTEVLQSWMRE
jgi:hypothetical protein